MNTTTTYSPPHSPTTLAAGTAPPTPPDSHDALHDIYGSSPHSPTLPPQHLYNNNQTTPNNSSTPANQHPHEILSDLPSRLRALNTSGYLEGLSAAKPRHIQSGFDEGYALGAHLGLCAGGILGILRGLVEAWGSMDRERCERVKGLWRSARAELSVETLGGREWVAEEGVWLWDVEGEEEGGLRAVAASHPVIKEWWRRVRGIYEECGWRAEELDGVMGSREEMGDVGRG